MIIYNDRVNTFRKMKEIDAVIDSEPTEKRIMDLADLRNRNILAFRELESYDKTGKWVNRHPLLEQYSIRTGLRKLLERDPDQFLDEFAKTSSYVSRYRSYLNNKKRSGEQHKKDQLNLEKHSEREQIMRELLNDKKKL